MQDAAASCSSSSSSVYAPRRISRLPLDAPTHFFHNRMDHLLSTDPESELSLSFSLTCTMRHVWLLTLAPEPSLDSRRRR